MARELKDRIHVIGPKELRWPFEGEPRFPMKGPRLYGHVCKVDPFPSYGHDVSLVAAIARLVERTFPVGFQVDYFLPEYEADGRTNGFAARQFSYEGNESRRGWEPVICLSGKRIPIHPAMTRYLIAHEYGHVAEWWIEDVRRMEEDDLRKQYLGLRPNSNDDYGGGRWHSNVGELLADDFRILVCGAEPEYWPHPGFEYPTECPEVVKFWNEARLEILGVAESATVPAEA